MKHEDVRELLHHGRLPFMMTRTAVPRRLPFTAERQRRRRAARSSGEFRDWCGRTAAARMADGRSCAAAPAAASGVRRCARRMRESGGRVGSARTEESECVRRWREILRPRVTQRDLSVRSKVYGEP